MRTNKRPEIRNVEDFWCWINTWGDRYKHYRWPSEAARGYDQAMRDALRALEQAGVTFDQVTDEAWDRWTGRPFEEEGAL